MLHLTTVEPHTFSVLNQLMKMPELQDFSLVGGSALSLLYGHRKSVDLDLFSNKPFENVDIVVALKNRFQDKFIMEEKPPRFGIFCFVDEVKIDIIRHPRRDLLRLVDLAHVRQHFAELGFAGLGQVRLPGQ